MKTAELKKRQKQSFRNPPLIEVIMGMQFSNPLNYRTLDLADFWTALDRTTFPSYTEMSPLDPYVPENMQVIEMSRLPKLRRIWFESEKKQALIQVQQDRFIYNWRRPVHNMENENCYPRYEKVKGSFLSYYKIFKGTMNNKNIENIIPSFLELTYVNFIDLPKNGLYEINNIFKDIAWKTDDRCIQTPERIDHKYFFRIADLPITLTIHLSTTQSIHDGKIGLSYELSARGPFNSLSETDVIDWFDNANLWITHSFTDMTTQYMHKKWGKE